MIRKARLHDGPAIHKLVNAHAQKGLMLARPLSEIYENIRDYFVIEANGKLAAVAGLHVNWEDLAEIKSVAVDKKFQKKGLGREVVQACLDEGLEIGIKRFYVLTYVPEFFKKMGFKRIDRAVLPHKVWTECVKCPKFPDCDEIAMLREVKNRAK